MSGAWQRLGHGLVPGTESLMWLLRGPHGELVIKVDGRELMSSAAHGSEDALADLACARIGGRAEARVLVGGLGMGFTLAAVLRGVGAGAEVVVAELVPVVVAWNRGPLGVVAGFPLEDPRAVVYEGDVVDLIRAPLAPFDAILLDVDNGPLGLTRPSNGWLYGDDGLAAAWEALRPGGILGVWSATRDAALTRRMLAHGFAVELVEVRARGVSGGGPRHQVWVAERPVRGGA